MTHKERATRYAEKAERELEAGNHGEAAIAAGISVAEGMLALHQIGDRMLNTGSTIIQEMRGIRRSFEKKKGRN